MTSKAKIGFVPQVMKLPLARILPTRPLRQEHTKSAKYRRITASILDVGVIEPLVIYPQGGADGPDAKYILLDGHLRFQILQSLGETETRCLVATDDESHTYNHHVNRLSSIQETFMLIRALDRGLSAERIAKALDLDLRKIHEKRDLLNGISDEAIDMLKDRPIAADALKYFKRVKTLRQIEMADLMIGASNYAAAYARAIYLATARDMLLEPAKPKKDGSVSPEDLARREREMQALARAFKLAQESYSHNMLNLVLALGYLTKLIENTRVARFLSQNNPDILAEFQKIVEVAALQT